MRSSTKKTKYLKNQGFSLPETLMTIGAIGVLSLAIYAVLNPSKAIAQAQVEQENLRSLSTAIESSFGLVGSFSGVSASGIADEKMAPNRMLNGTSLRTAWGSDVTITPARVRNDNDAFVIHYPTTESEVCLKLINSVVNSTYDIRVNNESIKVDDKFDSIKAAQLCGADLYADIDFVYYSGLVSGTAVAAAPLVMPTAPPIAAAPVSPIPNIRVPDVGIVDNATNPVGTAPSAAPPAVATPANPITPSPSLGTGDIPAPALPPSMNPNPNTAVGCSPPASRTVTENQSCAVGQYGIINRSAAVTYSCPEAWEAPVETWGAWTINSNSCTNCPAPVTQQQTQWVDRSEACPSGQVGSNTWQAEQRATRQVSYNCPLNTTSLPAPTNTPWSAWADTGTRRNATNTCAPPAPAPTAGRACQTSYDSGTRDAHDAYYTVSYSLGGGAGGGGCSISVRDNGVNGEGDCAGQVISFSEWEQQALPGDTYYESGGFSWNQGGSHQFWGWTSSSYEKVAGNSCPVPNDGSYRLTSSYWNHGHSPRNPYFRKEWNTTNLGSGYFECSMSGNPHLNTNITFACHGDGTFQGQPVVGTGNGQGTPISRAEYNTWSAGKPYAGDDMRFQLPWDCVAGDTYRWEFKNGTGAGTDEGYEEYTCEYR